MVSQRSERLLKTQEQKGEGSARDEKTNHHRGMRKPVATEGRESRSRTRLQRDNRLQRNATGPKGQ